MSEQSKKIITEIVESIVPIKKNIDTIYKKSIDVGDKELSIKIKKVQDGLFETVKHITERSA